MPHFLLRPRLFLSYSRSDENIAALLFRALTERGFEVFQDAAEILAGEDFVSRIVSALRRSDAVISLQTAASADSEWCQAELHQAHALQVPVVPVRVGEEVQLSRPLELLQRRVHTLVISDESQLAQLPEDLEQQLRRARRRRLTRVARSVAFGLLVAGGLTILAFLSVDRLNVVEDQRERQAALNEIAGAANVLAQGTIEGWATRFSTDETFLKDLLLMREGEVRPDAVRMNAEVLSTFLLTPRRIKDRWFIRDLDLRSLQIQRARWMNLTFQGRSLHDVHFQKSVFAGVVWGKGPTGSRPGLTLSKLRFEDSDFWFTVFAGTTGVDIEFVNSSFRGAEIDLSNLSLLRLVSREKRPEIQTLITDEISVVENSVILNRNLPPPPGVLDLSVPTEEAFFDGVVFSGVHFRGYIRPEWFHKCHFLHCVLPTTLQKDALEARGNVLDTPLWSDEPLD